ncbi:hypothetical protein F0562_019745 [Nyssa sinensis]|uniref:Uncharacterized protein n=1 Tax=Nyssa sinensis TaxID=561372 RepID=A0A5J5BS14_9ASTE|nr:hypothetical protein F0562_019745 [Nyssa sinensis]
MIEGCWGGWSSDREPSEEIGGSGEGSVQREPLGFMGKSGRSVQRATSQSSTEKEIGAVGAVVGGPTSVLEIE